MNPRPKWNNECVKTEAAKLIIEDVQAWMASMMPAAATDTKELTALLSLALIENADCYSSARYIEEFFEWPVNGELIRILDRAYIALPALTKPFVHAWVMENKVRFPAKEGQDIRIGIGGAEFTAKCVGVVAREARGFAELRTGDTVPVDAEDVVKVFKTKRPSGGTPTPPTGGTPVAPRAGAQLRGKKVA